MESWRRMETFQKVLFFSILGLLCCWILPSIALGEETYPPPKNNLTVDRIPINRGSVHQDFDAEFSQLIINGNFETGDFTGWTVKGDDMGTWVIFDKDFQPTSGAEPRPPFKGTFGAVTDQIGPGTRVLYQDIDLPSGSKAILVFADMLDNWAEMYDPELQVYRVEVVDPETGKVLKTLFKTEIGDPTHTPWTKRLFSLSQFAGKKIQIRFTEIDNFYSFNVWLDRVLVITFGGGAAPSIAPKLATTWGRMKQSP